MIADGAAVAHRGMPAGVGVQIELPPVRGTG